MRVGFQEQALRESESKYRMLMEQASDGIHTYDHEGRFLDANLALCEMLGYTREELLRLNVQDLIPAEDLATGPVRFDELRAGNKIINERRVRRKDGTIIPVEISGKMLPNGVLQAIVRDISERKQAEQAIRFQSNLLNIVEQAVIATDLSGTITYWNSFAEKLFGWTAAEIIERKISDTILPPGAQKQASDIMSRLSAGQSWSGEFTVQRRDGTTFLAFITDTPIYNDKGVMVGIVGVSSDITERIRAEERLKQSEEWLRAIFEASRDGILVEDNERIVYVNKSYTQLFGYDKPEELIGNHISLTISAEDVERMLEFGRRRMQGGLARSVYEFKGKRKDGTLIYVEASVSMSIVAGHTYITTTTRDIARRKQTHEALQNSEARYRLLFESNPLPVWVYDLQTLSFLAVNEAAIRHYGYSREEFLEMTIKDIRPLEDVPALLGNLSEPHLGLHLSNTSWRHRKKDGTTIYVEITSHPLVFEEQPAAVVLAHDVTERREAEEALRQAHDQLERRVAERTTELANSNEALEAEIRERSQLLRQLVTAQEDERRRISRELHDQMGQHITAIMLLISSLKDSNQCDASTHQRFGQLEQIANELDQEVSTLAWELRPTELDDLGLDTALGNYVAKWSERSQVRIDFQSIGLNDQRLPPQIETTVYRIAQESLNNIVKHAHASYVSLILEWRDNHVSTIIEDDGVGFDVEEALAAPVGERQMGLSGMRERATLADGTLNIESRPGMGTTVFLRIPVAVTEQGGKRSE